MEGTDALMIDVDEGEIVELLQHEMAGVIEDSGRRVIIYGLEEALKRCAIVQILARMNLEAGAYTGIREGVEHRSPATSQFAESFFDQAVGSLRPGIHEGPHKRSREG